MLEVLQIAGVVAFVIVLLVGLLAIFLGLPGTVVIFADALVFAAVTRFEKIPWWMLLILASMAATAELADNVLGVAAARKYGASTRSSLITVAGAVVGGVIVSSIFAAAATVMIPGVGTLVGSLLGGIVGAFGGAYAAAYLHELYAEKKPRAEAMRAAWGAMVGRLLGIVLKVVLAIGMIVLIVWRIWPQ
ncbi:MAG: DUF456 domain-containing protein [Armatimonadota bacterium]